MGDNYDWMGNVKSMGLRQGDWPLEVIRLSAIDLSAIDLSAIGLSAMGFSAMVFGNKIISDS
jgi:hypothetical protein